MPVDNHFSTFFDGGSLATNDVIVGLRNGVNTRFTFTAQSNYAYIIGTVVVGDFVTFANTIGGLKDTGFSPSNNGKTKVVMANSITTVNHIAAYSDIFGTVSQDVATAINSGNIQAGISGTAGYFDSFPSTVLKGRLRLQAANNAGDTITTISNDSFGQASTISIPDPSQSSSRFILSDSAGTQMIDTGNLTITAGDLSLTAGNISVDDGKIFLGNSSGSTFNNLVSYSPSASLGTLNLYASNSGGNYTLNLTNDIFGQSTTLSFPDPGVATADFILSEGITTQTINSGDLQVKNGNFITGDVTGVGSTYGFISYSPTAALGALSFSSANNSGNYLVNVTNSSFGQASTITIPDPGAASASFLLSSSPGTIHITSGNLQVDNGNIIAGSNGSAGYFQSYPSTVTSGTLKLAAVNSAGNFDVTISNASHAQSSVISIPDGAQASSNFIISNSSGTQTISTGSLALTSGNIGLTAGSLNITTGNVNVTTGDVTVTTGNIQTQDGNVIAGKTTGSASNSFISYTPTSALGNLTVKAANNAGNFNVIVTNAGHAQSTTLTIPDGAQTTSNFIISNSSGTQTIATGNLTLSAGTFTITSGNISVVSGTITASGNIQATNGNVIAGATTGSSNNSIISYTPTTSAGSLRLKAVNNSGNFDITVSNASHGQSTTLTIPDGAQTASNFIISNSSGTQTIATGSLALTSGSITLTSGNLNITSGNVAVTTGNIQTSDGNIIAGKTTGSTNNSFISYTPTTTLGNLTVKSANNAGNFTVTVTNASHAQASTYTIPDGGQTNSNFIISNSTGTQTIATGNLTLSVGDFTATSGNITATSGNITATDGNITAGSAAGATNYSFYSYTPTAALGFLTLYSTNNAGNFGVGITNESHGQTTVLTIPDGGSASSSFLLTNSAGTQTIATGSLALTTGNITLTTGNVQASDGDIIAGKTTGSTMNSFISYTPTTTLGSLRLKAANNSGNFNVTIENASHAQTTTLTIPDGGVSGSNFLISNSTSAQTIATGGLTLTAGNIIVSDGFIQASNNQVRAGKSGGCTDNQFISFSTGVNLGQLRLQCVDNSANIIVKISNASHAQNSTYSIPDSGATTANFIISKLTGTQHITTGSLQLDAGSLFIGTSAGGGTNGINIYPSGANKGYLQFISQNNVADYFVSVKNASHGQNTTYEIADAGVGSGSILTCALGAVNPQTNMFYKTYSGSITRAALAAGGTVTLLATSGSATYTILEIFIAAGTNFSGGGGNRNIEIFETTTGASYSIIPAATVQALSNQRWGTTAVPYPASVSIMRLFGSGNSLSARYNGGTTDYSTAGDLNLGILFARTA